MGWETAVEVEAGVYRYYGYDGQKYYYDDNGNEWDDPTHRAWYGDTSSFSSNDKTKPHGLNERGGSRLSGTKGKGQGSRGSRGSKL